MGIVLEISSTGATSCTNEASVQAMWWQKGFHTPLRQDDGILICAGQCHTFFSQVCSPETTDNHSTVGTGSSTLYHTEDQRAAAATLKTRFAFANAVDRDIIKVLKSVLGFPPGCSNCQAN